MGEKPAGVVLRVISCALLAACLGCHACSCNYDYLPPVADGPYSVPGQRAGSAFGGPVYRGPMHNGPLPDTAEEVFIEQAEAAVYQEEITRTLDEILAEK